MQARAYFQQAVKRVKARPQHHLSISLPHYEPVNDKAEAFHRSTAKVNLLPGGNQSGKTTTVAHDHVIHARNMPKGCKGLALTNTYKDIGKNLWPHYKECLSPHEWKWISGNEKADNPSIIELVSNGYRFYFGSYEQGRSAHQGAIWDYLHLDEEAPKEIWEETYRGTLARKARIGYSYTPIFGYDYVDDLIEKGKNHDYPHVWTPKEPMSLLENKHIDQDEIQAWLEMLSEKSRQVRIYGYHVSQEGLVYDDFDENVHVIDPFPIPDNWMLYRGLDFGWDHPTVSLICAWDGYTLYVISEYYQNHRLVKYHSNQFTQQLINIEFTSGHNQDKGVFSVSDHDKQLRMEYESVGISTQAAQKDVVRGIEQVRNLLAVHSDGNTRLKVFRHCKHTRDEFKRYHLPGEDKKGNLKEGEKADNPIKKYDDCMDPLRYIVVAILGYFDWNPAGIVAG